MKIAVLIKQVPDTETNIRLSGSAIDESGIKWIVSPYDEHAIEAALQVKEKNGGSITAVSIGPERVVETLRNAALALGVDRAVHIRDDGYNVFDISYAAFVLAAFLKKEPHDIILTGHTAIDSQSSMVPSMIAEYLDVVHISNAIALDILPDRVKIKREIEGGVATMESTYPVVVTATKNLNQPRYPNLKGIMASKKKEIESIDAATLSEGVSRIAVLSMELPPARPPGRIIEGTTPEQKAAELVRILKEDAKVI
jgi:electron transfer flavoprotein beta subunit